MLEDKILKYLPFAGGLLIFFGVLKISVFYHYFGISVLPYLSVSDVLLLFLSDVNTILAVFIIGLIHLTISGDIIDNLGWRIDYILLKYRKRYRIFFGITFVILALIVGLDVIPISLWNIYVLVFLASQFVTFIFMKRAINTETGLPEVDFRAKRLLKLLTVIIITAMLPLLSLKDIRDLKNTNIRVTIHLNDGNKIETSSRKYYLGKAGEYHFFYSESRNESSVIRNELVQSIEKKTIP